MMVVREGREEARSLAAEVGYWLSGRGVESSIMIHRRREAHDPEMNGERPDLVLVLGGDGTFISAARSMLGLDLPMLGVNMGRVGFLTEVCPSRWQDELDCLLSGGYFVEERLALGYSVTRGGETVHRGRAVNDLVLGRGRMARLIHVGVRFGGEKIASVRADGLIVSTPTGSTAYAVSAGGPLIHPEVQSFCLTPVCPFRNYFKSMLLPPDREVGLCSEEPSCDVFLTEDGQDALPVRPGDEVRIRRSSHPLRLVRLHRNTYFSTLVDKGFLREF